MATANISQKKNHSNQPKRNLAVVPPPLYFPHQIRKEAQVRLRVRGWKDDLKVGPYGSLGRLGDKSVKEVQLDLLISPEHADDLVNIRAVSITQGKFGKEISTVPGEIMENGMSSFLFHLKIVKDGDFFRVDLTETPAILIMEKSGKVSVQHVVVVAQKNEFFFLALRTYEVQIYRGGSGKSFVPAVTGEHMAFEDLQRFLLQERYYKENRKDLPYLETYKPVAPDIQQLRENQILILWTTARRQVAGGLNSKGESVRAHWTQLMDSPDWKPSTPQLKYIPVGSVLNVSKFIPPADTRSHIKWEARGVTFAE